MTTKIHLVQIFRHLHISTNLQLTKLAKDRRYRTDIDGLRAVAVTAVIVFHFGFLPMGYMGVDVFFVISGFLITGLIFNKINADRFSVIEFYMRRARRIMPLAIFVCLVALLIGMATMLPDDMENLAQSVIATNFLSNNILQAITTKNYWDVVNEYKPLMHTWSLGVEEQYYLVYPFLLMILMKKRTVWTIPIISVIAGVSLTIYFLDYFKEYQKFYLIFFRFWELAAGGIAAMALNGRLIEHRFAALPILLLALLLCFEFSFISSEFTLVAVIFLTVAVLATANEKEPLSQLLLENSTMAWLGKISFSLYMWHQVLLAFARYFWVQELQMFHLTIIFLLNIALSSFSYLLIEQPFRNQNRIANKPFLIAIASFFMVSTGLSFYIYYNAGVLKDIPELGIKKSEAERNLHSQYNRRIHNYDRSFDSTDKIKILVIGNSFGRDWANVLLESKFGPDLDISYLYAVDSRPDAQNRIDGADVIFQVAPIRKDLRLSGIPKQKLWAVGTKNFGTSSGIFYNRKGPDYYQQRALMEKGYFEKNETLRLEWEGQYLDYIEKIIDDKQTVPVFTPSKLFISQDCRHLTRGGAQYFSQLFEQDLEQIFSKVTKQGG
jgi:peptidoglycan/LPS O-acetylase OafA/YrhL